MSVFSAMSLKALVPGVRAGRDTGAGLDVGVGVGVGAGVGVGITSGVGVGMAVGTGGGVSTGCIGTGGAAHAPSKIVLIVRVNDNIIRLICGFILP